MVELRKFDNKASIFTHFIESLLDSPIISVYCKDIKGNYLEVNQRFLENAGLNSHQVALSMTDYDFWELHQAQYMRVNDDEVYQSEKPKTIIESAKVGNETQFFLSHKMPIFTRKNKKIGVFGQSTRIDPTQSELCKPIFHEIKPMPLTLIHNLSKRQLQCLYHLAMGKTAKQIAKQLDLSHRTVEFYIDNIKKKLDCYSRSELITKALKLNLF